MTPADYLKLPYARLVFPEQDGSWSAEILEFRGCFATGDNAEEALRGVERVAESWILGMQAKDESIPNPVRGLYVRDTLARMIYDALVQSIRGGQEYCSLIGPDDFTATFDCEFDFRVAADRLTEALAAAKDAKHER
jgi:predicted RNase H-like HicB family nuclease